MNVRAIGVALLAVLAVSLAACDDPKPDANSADVASLASADAGPAGTSAPAAAQERPLIRTDTSAADEQRMWDAWLKCLEANGGNKAAAAGATYDGGGVTANTDPEADARSRKAEKACVNKEPEEVWERAKRTDPTYDDKLRDWVTCIRAQGIDVWTKDGYLSFESLPPDNQMKKIDKCQDKAFGTA
jgi:hypothetical protein